MQKQSIDYSNSEIVATWWAELHQKLFVFVNIKSVPYLRRRQFNRLSGRSSYRVYREQLRNL